MVSQIEQIPTVMLSQHHLEQRQQPGRCRSRPDPSTCLCQWNDVETVHGRIGNGSFSMILKVSCRKVAEKSAFKEKTKEERFAVKCIREGDLDGITLRVAFQDLQKEAQVLLQLRHPSVIRIRAVGTKESPKAPQPEISFLVLDLLEETLGDRLKQWEWTTSKQRQPLPSLLLKRILLPFGKNRMRRPQEEQRTPPSITERLSDIACKLAEAMAYVHAQGIVHCDLKPENVGFDSLGKLKIFDFGLSRDLKTEDGIDTSNTVVGTYRYMPPEIMRGSDGDAIGFGADVYSFAILMWQLVTLKKPHQHVRRLEDIYEIVVERQERPSLTEVLKQVDFERSASGTIVPFGLLSNVLEDAWHIDPKCRPSFASIQRRLTHILEETRRTTKTVDHHGLNNSFQRTRSPRKAKVGFHLGDEIGRIGRGGGIGRNKRSASSSSTQQRIFQFSRSCSSLTNATEMITDDCSVGSC